MNVTMSFHISKDFNSKPDDNCVSHLEGHRQVSTLLLRLLDP